MNRMTSTTAIISTIITINVINYSSLAWRLTRFFICCIIPVPMSRFVSLRSTVTLYLPLITPPPLCQWYMISSLISSFALRLTRLSHHRFARRATCKWRHNTIIQTLLRLRLTPPGVVEWDNECWLLRWWRSVSCCIVYHHCGGVVYLPPPPLHYSSSTTTMMNK